MARGKTKGDITKQAKATAKRAVNEGRKVARKTGATARKTANDISREGGKAAHQAEKTVRKTANDISRAGRKVAHKTGTTVRKTADKISNEGRKASEKAESGIKKTFTGNKKDTSHKNFKCQICGKLAKTPADAVAHMLDHGSAAMEDVSKIIKNQTEGNVSQESKNIRKNKEAMAMQE